MHRELAVWALPAFLAAGQITHAATADSDGAAVTPSAAAGVAAPIVQSPPLFTADDLLLFEVDADGAQLSDSFGAYSSRAGVFLPLGELARLLDFAVTVDPATKRADGWVLSQKRALTVDLAAGRAVIAGKEVKLSESAAAMYQDEIYLRQDVIEQLLPIKLKADVSSLTLTITPTEPLPFQQRLARERLRQGLSATHGGEEKPLIVNTPYRLFTPPAVDLDLNLGAGNHAPKETAQWDLRAAGDLAFAGGQLYVASDQDGRPSNVRFLLERKDPAGHAAGPFGATRSDLGDTFSPSLPLGPRSATGRGFEITSVPLDQSVVFNKVDLRGELQLGYEVELYVNEILRGSTSQPVDGRYEFLQVPLAFGLNVIRLVFYGPRGERREEVQRINVGGDQLAKGQTTYSFGAIQEDRSLFPVGHRDQPADLATPGAGQMRITGMISHGFTDQLTLSAGFARFTPSLNQPRDLGLVAIDTSFHGVAVQGDAAHDDRGGSALALGLAGRLAGASLIFRDSEYQGGFIDEAQPLAAAATPLRRDTSLYVDAQPKLFGDTIPLSLRFDRAQQANGQAVLQATGQTSQPIGRYLFSSTLSYEATSGGPAAGSRQLSGELDVSGLVDGGWQIRGGLAYQLLPTAEANSVTVTADRNIGERMALHLGLVQTLVGPSETTVQLGDTVRLDKADISFVGAYTTHTNDLRLGVQVSLGFLFDPFRRRYEPAGPNVADGGAVALRAFIDRNGDGRFEPGDTPTPDVVVQGGRHPVKTDAAGEALIAGLGSGPYGRLQIDTTSIDDPFVTAPPSVIQIVPRPGRVAIVDYAMHVTGEVQIHASFLRPGAAPRGLSALDLQLVDPKGVVAADGRTEYDGTLLIEGVRPGHYRLRIDPDQAERLRLALEAPVEVDVPVSGGLIGPVDADVVLAVGARPPEAPPAAPAPMTEAPAAAASAAVPPSARPAPVAAHHTRHHRRHHRRQHARVDYSAPSRLFSLVAWAGWPVQLVAPRFPRVGD